MPSSGANPFAAWRLTGFVSVPVRVPSVGVGARGDTGLAGSEMDLRVGEERVEARGTAAGERALPAEGRQRRQSPGGAAASNGARGIAAGASAEREDPESAAVEPWQPADEGRASLTPDPERQQQPDAGGPAEEAGVEGEETRNFGAPAAGGERQAAGPGDERAAPGPGEVLPPLCRVPVPAHVPLPRALRVPGAPRQDPRRDEVRSCPTDDPLSRRWAPREPGPRPAPEPQRPGRDVARGGVARDMAPQLRARVDVAVQRRRPGRPRAGLWAGVDAVLSVLGEGDHRQLHEPPAVGGRRALPVAPARAARPPPPPFRRGRRDDGRRRAAREREPPAPHTHGHARPPRAALVHWQVVEQGVPAVPA